MPEIGDQLRETRMRNRIDIADVEAATKIRAKYLRALENEEWDLLPGPTFVKTFLRTYADYLGLDARNLVEDYRARYERPAAQELTPFGTSRGGRRQRSRRPVFAPWMAVIIGILALVGALYALGQWGDDPEQEARRPAASTPAPAAPAEEKKKERKRKAPARPKRVRLQIQPTGPVSVCLEDVAGQPLIQNVTLAANQDTETFRTSKRLRVSFGTGAAVMRIDGKAYQVSDDAPIGYEIRPGRKPRTLPEDERPTCDG
ncbi:MAG TPA: helix-turn-helix domain-containing protein [Solirubrobacteraceae bacterium]|nr:helix-turn-helix domain-containing protein [Solirubrobacteraceae bacterium]